MHLRGPDVRRPLGHAVVASPAACAPTPSSSTAGSTATPRRAGGCTGSSDRSHRWSRASRLDEAFLDVTGARAPVRATAPTDRPRHPRPGARRAVPAVLGRGRPLQADGQAGLEGGQAPCRPGRASSPGPGWSRSGPDEELDFLHPMPVRALWGIGPATEQRLLGLGVTHRRRAGRRAPRRPRRYLGHGAGRHLSELARGRRPDPVVPEQAAKSIGHEETFATDLWDPDDLHRGSTGWSTPRPPPCARRGGRPHGHREAPVRRLHVDTYSIRNVSHHVQLSVIILQNVHVARPK